MMAPPPSRAPRGAKQAAEIIPGRLYFAALAAPLTGAGAAAAGVPPGAVCYLMDADLVYEPFCADFGPCNLAHLYRFCRRVEGLLAQAAPRGDPVYLLVGAHPHKRANAAAMVGGYAALMLDRDGAEAYAPLAALEPYAPFRDASCGAVTFELTVADVVAGMAKARAAGFVRWAEGEPLDVEEYEHYEQVENGDLNWIVPGKLMAFSGPSATPRHFSGWRTFTPEDYVQYFRERGVQGVVRLNKRMYDAARFEAAGVAHHDMYFPDGTCPTEAIMYRFLELVESTPGALAVHCKAGLGRTGVLICAHMARCHGFTAREAMGYIRVCRPGSVIGPQQHFLEHYAPRLAAEGRAAGFVHATPKPSRAAAAARADAAAAAAGGRRVVALTATSVAAELAAHPAPRAPAAPTSAERRAGLRPRPVRDAHGDAEPAGIVSMPPAVPAGGGKPGAPRFEIHATAVRGGAATPGRAISARSKSGDAGLATPPAVPSAARAPPSSTKRLLAPNGQPRKVGVALDFDAAAGGADAEALAAALVDCDMADLGAGAGGAVMAGGSDDGSDSWTVGSAPQPRGSRVGALAAAAGRSAAAFVDAFRSAVGTHSRDYASQRGGR